VSVSGGDCAQGNAAGAFNTSLVLVADLLEALLGGGDRRRSRDGERASREREKTVDALRQE
jgi:hypothetical protein